MQGAQVLGVAGHGAAPEADVDEGLVARDGLLLLERGDVDRRRDGVQRHVDDGGHAAGGRGAGGGREALPLRAAGLVDVHVGVDQAGDHDLVVVQFDDLVALEAHAEGAQGVHLAAADAHLAGSDARRGEHALAAHHELERLPAVLGRLLGALLG